MKLAKPMFAPHTSLVERVWYFALRGLAVLTLLYLVLPVLVIVPLSFSSSTFLSYPIPSYSLRWYQNLVTSDEWRMAAKNSFIVAPAATIVATVLGTLAAIGFTLLASLSMDMLVFYVFFELTLVPVFLLVGLWGGPDRQVAAQRMFLHTLAGGLCTLLGLLAIAASKFGAMLFQVVHRQLFG